MAKLQINQLTNNPEFARSEDGPDFEFRTTQVNRRRVLEGITQGGRSAMATNITLTEVDAGECVLSFWWNGDYEGVCVFMVHILPSE